MSTPEPMTMHPSDETLAAFIDKRLDAPARRSLIEHIVICDDCREVTVAAGELTASENAERPRFSKPPVAAISLAAAAVIAVALLTPAIREKLFTPSPGIPSVVEASEGLEHRRTISRVSGGFPYKATNTKRGAEENDAHADLRLQAVAAELEEKIQKNATPKNLHTLGVAYLALGKAADAVEPLEKAVTKETGAADVLVAIERSTNAGLLNDLAAAYYQQMHNPKLQLAEKATKAAEAAWRLEQSPEAAWNRALIIEALRPEKEAAAAWNDYLKIDPQSQWSEEARRNIRDLTEFP